MAKSDTRIEIASPRKKLIAKTPRHIRARNFLIEMPDPLTEIGLEECTISISRGKQTLKGVTKTKRAVHIMLRDGGNGFQEQIISVCAALEPRERRIEAKKLRKEGMSQTAIAARLGVSQKTISNDLDGR